MTDHPGDHVHPFVSRDDEGLSMHFDIHSVQSRMYREDPDALVLDYTRLMMGFLLLHPAARHLLMIGLGGGSLPKYCHRHVPLADITVVEINPHVIALRSVFGVPPDGDRFRVVQADGAVHVAALSTPVDGLLVDAFTYDGQPEALCTSDFYAGCRRALVPDGMLVVNLQAGDPQWTVWRDRVASAFDGAVVTVRCGEGGNVVVLAGEPCRRMSATGLRRQLARWKDADPTHRALLQQAAARLIQAI